MSYNIFDVAKDALTGNIEHASVEDSIKRQEICASCEANVANVCTACGCFIPMKIRLAKTECPMEKWGPVDPKE